MNMPDKFTIKGDASDPFERADFKKVYENDEIVEYDADIILKGKIRAIKIDGKIEL